MREIRDRKRGEVNEKTNTTVLEMHNLRYIIVKNFTGSQQTQSFPVDSGQYRLLIQILLISYNSY